MTGRPVRGSTVLEAPGLLVVLDDEGTVTSAGSPGSPVSWLGRSGGLEVAAGAGPLVLGPPRVVVDVDEVETERSGGGLRTVVRHSVEQGWTVRVVLVNESDAELVLEEVRLGWRRAPGTVPTALAAGAQAVYAVQPAGGDGPVLVGRLRSGSQTGVDEDGFLLGPLVLAPHHRWAAAWRWEVVPDARRVPAGDLPRTTWLDLGQPAVLPGSPDVAVVAPGLVVELEDDRVEVEAVEPGTSVVELRSARGTAAYALTWAPDLDDVLDARLQELLDGPTTPAGTLRLVDAADGLVVQDALARRVSGLPEELADALELLTGDLVERLDEDEDEDEGTGGGGTEGVDAVTLAFLGREADRTVDRPTGDALLDVAVRRLQRTGAPAPGLGLAGVGLALALVRGGRPATDVVAHLAAVRGAVAGPDGGDLELALLLRPREAVVGDEVLAALRRLGAALGAGLPGRVVPAAATPTVAYASALLALVDEPTGQRLRDGWGVTASELARRTAAEARARIARQGDAPGDRRALCWLVLGRR